MGESRLEKSRELLLGEDQLLSVAVELSLLDQVWVESVVEGSDQGVVLVLLSQVSVGVDGQAGRISAANSVSLNARTTRLNVSSAQSPFS